MDVRFEKAWRQLRKQDREVIEEVKSQEAAELAMQIVMREEALIQKRWLKALCIAMNKNGRYGRKRLLLVLGWWKEVYRIMSRIATNEELDAYLDSEIERIFGKGGYPTEYIDKLEEV